MNLYVPRKHLNWNLAKKVHVVTVMRQQPFKCGEATWINKVVSTFKRQKKRKRNPKTFVMKNKSWWQYYKGEELLNKEASTTNYHFPWSTSSAHFFQLVFIFSCFIHLLSAEAVRHCAISVRRVWALTLWGSAGRDSWSAIISRP